MKYMAPVLALLLSGSAQAQGIGDFSYRSWNIGTLPPAPPVSEVSARPGEYIVACTSQEAADFVRTSFSKGSVHGWMMAAIMSQDMRDGASNPRFNMGSCELDTYQGSIGRMVLDDMEELDPEQPLRHYLMLPAMPPTFFEQSEHGEEEETSSYSSGNKG